MERGIRDRLNQLVSSDEAPDTGDDSDEDLVTNYLANNGGSNGANNDNLVPTIHITPQSPNGNRVLEDNLLQLARIQERIQEMRMSNAQANLNVSSTNSKNRLSTSCPSLNEGSDPNINLDDDTSNTTDNSHHAARNKNRHRIGGKIDNNANSSTTSKMRKIRQGRHRSVSVSSGDSDDDETDTVDGSAAQKIRQRSASTAPKEVQHAANMQSATPPNFKESRFFHGSRHKSSHLMAQFPSLQKSVSTPSIVVEQAGSSSKKKHHHRDLPEPTHVFLQRLIAEHEWTRPSGSDSDSDEDTVNHHPISQTTAVRSVSAVGHPHASIAASSAAARIRTHPLATQINSTPSPQLSLAEFLQDDPTLEDDDSRKRRRKKERSSLFFRKKKDKGVVGNNAANNGKAVPTIQHHPFFDPSQSKGGLAKVSSSINLGGNARGVNMGSKEQGQGKMSQHSHSMSSLRKASISAPSHTVPLTAPPLGQNSNFYLAKTDFGKNYDENDLGHEDTAGLLESEFLPDQEFAEGGGPAAIRDLETPKHLRIEEEEPETWTQTVRTETISSLSTADIKRQEHIYEFILTESNHCQVLKVIQKIFIEGMFKYLSLPKEIVDRIFPYIETLIELHFKFLDDLRTRQNQHPVVETIADILHSQFSGESGEKWREAYGAFCSGHNDAVSVFKDLMKSDRRFQQFVRQCSENPLLKKKGVPECILFVTTRITKYPLLIEPLIKAASRDRPAEFELLRQANIFVKDILKDVNSRVAEKERKQRLFDIYNKVDPKSTLSHNGKKFKKSDLLLSDRKLMFEGIATLQQTRNRNLQVNVIVLSDILFFLHENNGKLYFISPENKPTIVPVKTLIARERSGGSSKSLNLLSTEGFEQEPEIYELEIMQPPTRDDWITGIRDAVDAASPGSDSDPDNDFAIQQRKSVDNKYLRLRRLTAELRGKDIELAHVLESKMKIMTEILEIVHGDEYQRPTSKPDYMSLVREKKQPGQESELSKEQLLVSIQEASRLASSIYSSVTNLSRSVSSAGERHSNVYSSPSLPRRAETFSGFDKELQNQKPKIKEIDIGDGGEREIAVNQVVQYEPPPPPPKVDNKQAGPQPLLMTLEPEQQQAAAQLTHYMNNVMCMVAEHFTSLESLKAELSESRERANISGGRYKQNQRFEEMRRLQETLAQEKKEWFSRRDILDQECEAKKVEMLKYQTEIDRGLKDVKEQREQLYRKLEVLRAQGIELGPNLSVLKTDPVLNPSKNSPSSGDSVILYKEVQGNSTSSPSLTVASSSGSSIRKSSSLTSASSAIMTPANNVLTGGSLKKESLANLHLMSAANESKIHLEKQEIKQQIPVKLSTLSTSSSSSKLLSKKPSSSVELPRGSGTGKGITNLAVKPETVQQLLPFKLSEDSKISPKHHSSKQPQYYHQFDQPMTSGRNMIRSGSPPQMVYSPGRGGSLRYSNSNNTLPKSGGSIQKVTNYGNNSGNHPGGGGGNSSSGANSDEDKVIYF